MILLLVAVGFTQNSALQAQQTKNGPVNVASVTSHTSANGTVVSIAADGPLNRAQTWQDREGYHVVVPAAGAQHAIRVGKGIKVRQLDHTLEIVIQTKPGANVTVQPTANHLNINVDGKLDPRPPATDSNNSGTSSNAEISRQSEEGSGPGQQSGNSKAARASQASAERDMTAAKTSSFADTSSEYSGSQTGSHSSAPTQGVPGEPEKGSGEASVISGATISIVLGLGCLGLLVLRRRRSTHLAEAVTDEGTDYDAFDYLDYSDETTEANILGKTKGSQENLMKRTGSGGANGASPQRKSLGRLPTMAAALYGAYQVDQEIGKLVQGQQHRMDVLASRAPDDLRAIEASLLKALTAADAGEDLRRRARLALEEYGFVARHSAALLLAADPYERTSAARLLGDIKSPAALPFLLEALYDHESLVRNQAVLSIGELRLPSAIGALLDIARKHPDVPGTLLSRALNACSLGGLDFFDDPIPQPHLLSVVDAHLLANEIIKLEPASVVEELPESADDERQAQALLQVESHDIAERCEAIKVLAQFSVRSSVTALAKVARLDSEASVRALAISSLAFINHETVFPAILIGMADESREVRAAAARSLSRLSFDRADAYIRVTETDDAEILHDVAQACIKAGIAAQGIDRLSSRDHQAHEALSVVSLLVKANTIEPLLEAIAHHPNIDVRLIAVYILGMVGQPEVVEQLRQLAEDCTPEALKHALLETISELELCQAEESNAIGPESDLESETEHELESESEYEFAAQPECDLEPNEVESSGLTRPTIA